MVRNLFIKVATGLLLFAGSQSFAGTNYWRNFEGKEAPSQHEMTATAKDYTVFSLDQNAMKSFLFGLSTDPAKAQTILIPTPDRQYKSFHIWKTPLLEEPLASQHPEIQTFTAVSDEDPNVTAKVTYNIFGFNALIYNGSNTFFIEGYNQDADGYYVAYYKRESYSKVPTGPCLLNETTAGVPAGNGSATEVNTGDETIGAKVHGSVRHHYRLALSCTGEYAHNVMTNPTVSGVLNIMVATVNNINGYYEREFSVSMTLIGTNALIIYTDPTTDPYSCNNNLNCLIDEVNTNITNVIGNSAYDIGHILCTAGGGLAQLSAVCGGGKARGTSSSGGATDIHVPLHEMGHQFGSNHTFSAGTGGCQGNGNENTAYEPGAGISTMSYSGLCDPNNVGSPEDDYFHVSSLKEIDNFITGQGSSCGTSETAQNVISIPAITDTFYIPKNTPFELTAPIVAAPQDGASVLYNWEQWDLGNFEGTEAQNANATSGPLFRSYYPTTSRIRSYPEYTNINSGAYGDGAVPVGQRITKAVRPINFKLTVRSIYQGWGTYEFMDNTVVMASDAAVTNFRCTAPSSNQTWNPNETKTVTWTMGGSPGASNDSVKCKWVNIYLSKDNGATFPYLLVANAPNTGSYTVTVPANVNTTQGRIKVKGAGNVFYDIGKGQLTITGDSTLGVNTVNLTNNFVIYPNPASTQITIANKIAGKTLVAVMYNAVGQQVWSGAVSASTQINVAAFARGNYMIQVLDEKTGERSTEKIVLR